MYTMIDLLRKITITVSAVIERLEKGSFWAKKWRSNQNDVLIESGVLLPRIRYVLGHKDFVF